MVYFVQVVTLLFISTSDGPLLIMLHLDSFVAFFVVHCMCVYWSHVFITVHLPSFCFSVILTCWMKIWKFHCENLCDIESFMQTLL